VERRQGIEVAFFWERAWRGENVSERVHVEQNNSSECAVCRAKRTSGDVVVRGAVQLLGRAVAAA
jgi:hypothetical protein